MPRNKKKHSAFWSYTAMGAGFALGAALISTAIALAGIGAKKAMDLYEQRALPQEPTAPPQFPTQTGQMGQLPYAGQEVYRRRPDYRQAYGA